MAITWYWLGKSICKDLCPYFYELSSVSMENWMAYPTSAMKSVCIFTKSCLDFRQTIINKMQNIVVESKETFKFPLGVRRVTDFSVAVYMPCLLLRLQLHVTVRSDRYTRKVKNIKVISGRSQACSLISLLIWQYAQCHKRPLLKLK